MKKILKKLIVYFITLAMTASVFTGMGTNKTLAVELQEESQKGNEIAAEDLVDFVVDVEGDREIRILQLTDTQIIDAAQARDPEKLTLTQKELWKTENIYENCFKYIENAIEQTNPDLILITGDLVYGMYDDEGTSFTALIEFMESFDIPWAPVFGNHDNESLKGVDWQCEQLTNAKNCLFKRGDVTGNCNYTIGIRQNDELVRVVYMMDSNGCALNNSDPKVKETAGFGDDQKEWIELNAKKIEEACSRKVPSFLAFHIPTSEFLSAVVAAGYQPEEDSSETTYLYVIGTDVEAQNDDFGSKGEILKGINLSAGFLDILKEYNFDGVFVGHNHKNNISVLYEGIRWTFCLKTGKYDRYNSEQLGGTYIEVEEGGKNFNVKHVYYNSEKIPEGEYPPYNSEGNLFANGDCSNGSEDWIFYAGSDYAESAGIVNNAVEFKVKKFHDTNRNQLRLDHLNVPLEAGKIYKVSFWVKCSETIRFKYVSKDEADNSEGKLLAGDGRLLIRAMVDSSSALINANKGSVEFVLPSDEGEFKKDEWKKVEATFSTEGCKIESGKKYRIRIFMGSGIVVEDGVQRRDKEDGSTFTIILDNFELKEIN